jgi:hypothetical protein
MQPTQKFQKKYFGKRTKLTRLAARATKPRKLSVLFSFFELFQF